MEAINLRARHLARVGTVVSGTWRLERLLGWGSTSAVYEAVGMDGAHAAIKILNASLSHDRAVVERFLREAYVAGAIRHRAIVGVHGDGVSDGCVYLVLDLLDGETLEERRVHMGGKLPLESVVPLADELMSALTAVHAAGVVHRDLKPQNVFITSHDEVRLLDFGTARVFEREKGKPGGPRSLDGLVVGSPSFMAPEQARGERDGIDARSDIWSLGATLFTVLSGAFVHLGKGPHQRLLAAATQPARSLAEAAPLMDPAIVAVVDRALAFDRAARFPNVGAMRQAFRGACSYARSDDAPMSEPPPDAAMV